MRDALAARARPVRASRVDPVQHGVLRHCPTRPDRAAVARLGYAARVGRRPRMADVAALARASGLRRSGHPRATHGAPVAVLPARVPASAGVPGAPPVVPGAPSVAGAPGSHSPSPSVPPSRTPGAPCHMFSEKLLDDTYVDVCPVSAPCFPVVQEYVLSAEQDKVWAPARAAVAAGPASCDGARPRAPPPSYPPVLPRFVGTPRGTTFPPSWSPSSPPSGSSTSPLPAVAADGSADGPPWEEPCGAQTEGGGRAPPVGRECLPPAPVSDCESGRRALPLGRESPPSAAVSQHARDTVMLVDFSHAVQEEIRYGIQLSLLDFSHTVQEEIRYGNELSLGCSARQVTFETRSAPPRPRVRFCEASSRHARLSRVQSPSAA